MAPRGEAEGPGIGSGAGLVRDRLIHRLLGGGGVVGCIVAPAGSGKSTLLAQCAAAHPGPVAFCGSPGPDVTDEASLVGWIARRLVGSSPEVAAGTIPTTAVGLVERLRRLGGPTLLVAIDDAQQLDDLPAGSALSALVDALPPTVRLLVASRVRLEIDLSRRRVENTAVEVDYDDLRFRSWEVERLFRDVYRLPLGPEESAALARRTNGWAASLQLFHLSTAHKTVAQRRAMMDGLQRHQRLLGEYLTRHMLAELPGELREFLVRSSVLRHPTAALCDVFLSRTDSAAILDELERRQLFTDLVGADGSGYRYHPVLQAHLEGHFVELLGADGARAEYARAAALLESAGQVDDALFAYARAELWPAIARLLGYDRPELARLGLNWLEVLPAATIEDNPWLLIARARGALHSGALDVAAALLRQAESSASATIPAEAARRLRLQVSAWSGPLDGVPTWEPLGLIRQALVHDPAWARQRADVLASAEGRFAEAVAALLCGEVTVARRALQTLSCRGDRSPLLAVGARMLSVVPPLFAGRVQDGELAKLADEVEVLGVPWLERIARGLLAAIGPDSAEHVSELVELCRREGDRWGEAALSWLGCFGRSPGDPTAADGLVRTARTFAELGAGVLEVWVLCHLALTYLRQDRVVAATATAHEARTKALHRQVPLAAAIADLVLGTVSGRHEVVARARDVLIGAGCLPPGPWEARWEPATIRPDELAGPVVLRCLGCFQLTLGPRTVDVSAVKPKERSALFLLAIRAGSPVHREYLIESLWPGADPQAGLRRLQVAVSSLRRLLEPDIGRGASRYLRREGDAYVLSLPGDSDVDAWAFDRAMAVADDCRRRHDGRGEDTALRQALESYGGDLLPEAGPAEWAAGPRSHWQQSAATTAARLAALRLGRGDHAGAAAAARRGLEIDRWRDELWQLIMQCLEQAGHPAAAARVREEYGSMLCELGLTPPVLSG